MMLKDAAHEEVLYVVQNLRQSSRDEIFGCTEEAPDQFARRLYFGDGFKWVGYWDGKPAAIIGANRIHGGVWGLFGFGTDDWQRIWRSVTGVARRDMMRAVREAGAHRAHCVALADHTATHAWLRALGAVLETPMPGYGKDGQDYVMFAWLKETKNVR